MTIVEQKEATRAPHREAVFIGACPVCGTGLRQKRGAWFLDILVLCDTCPGAPPTVRLLPVKGVASAKKCDARCTNAHTRICNCQCAGRNHGADHDIAEVAS